MRADLREIFQTHVPSAAVDYCLSLGSRFDFVFRLRKARSTKVGDFRAGRAGPSTITVNRDLSHFLFLITYIHEVAHHAAYLEAPRSRPHGRAWKTAFQGLMMPVLNEGVFPPELLEILTRHLRNPKASCFSDTLLTRALRKYEPPSPTLKDLERGALFFLNKRLFKKGDLRRTRVLCQLEGTRRKYLISAEARVSVL